MKSDLIQVLIRRTSVNETTRNQTFISVIHLPVILARSANLKRRRRRFIQLAAMARPRCSRRLQRQKPADRMERDEERFVEDRDSRPWVFAADHLGQESFPDL